MYSIVRKKIWRYIIMERLDKIIIDAIFNGVIDFNKVKEYNE